MDNMQYIDVVLKEEKHRNEVMREAYKKRLEVLPQGSLILRELNGKTYCYLKYREKSKVIQKYAGTIDSENTIREGISERKHLQNMLSMLEKEYKRILKMETIK